METTEKQLDNDAVPYDSLCRLLDYLWADELDDYRRTPAHGHIFLCLVELANFVHGGTDWSAVDFLARRGMVPGAGWRVAGDVAMHPTPESRMKAISESELAWEWEGHGSRYLIRGNSSPLCVVIGWDRPLATFFAQVWEVPDGAGHHEDGDLLLWAGTAREEVPGVEELQGMLAPFVALPRELVERMECDRLRP